MIRIALFALFCLASPFAAAEDNEPRYIAIACPLTVLEVASETSADIECGLLRVPESRGDADSRLISVFVMRLGARQESQAAPLLHLAGGPGNSASADLRFWLESPLSEHHDILLIDQRGSGLSLPSLNCPEFDSPDRPDLAKACHERLTRNGIALAAYDEDAIVSDIIDLIAALELKQVNVYGFSYGARLALRLMRRAPNVIRAALLDSAYPSHADALMDSAYAFHLAMERLFDDCAAQQKCQGEYPDLRESFYGLLDALNAEPISVVIEGRPRLMDDSAFAEMALSALNGREARSRLPALISHLADGGADMGPLLEAISASTEPVTADAQSEGLFLNLRCAEVEAAGGREGSIKRDERVPLGIDQALGVARARLIEDCEAWRVLDLRGRDQELTRIHTPTLLMSGAYDPISPAHWSVEATAYLETSWRFTLPNAGHGVLGAAACADEIALAFLLNPQEGPAAACLADPPRISLEAGEP